MWGALGCNCVVCDDQDGLCLLRSESSILPAECMLAVMQEALSDPVFVIDYKRSFAVQQDFEVVLQACPEL